MKMRLISALLAAPALISLCLVFTPSASAGELENQLISAAKSGDVAGIQAALDRGANIEATDNDGQTALMQAARWGHADAVKLLLEKGANVKSTDKNGTTALLCAAPNGSADMVKLLLEKGSDIEAKDDDGYTALMNAAIKGSADVVKLLLDNGANIEAKNRDGKTALMFAFKFGNVDVVNILLKKLIKLVQAMGPPPKIPAEAKRDFIKGNTFILQGKDASAAQDAIDAYKDALSLAPWWGNAYFNLGLAYEAAGRYKEAEESMNFFLLTKPEGAWKNKAEQELGKIEAEEKLESESK